MKLIDLSKKPPIYQNKIKCPIRHRNVNANPEEIVRQRVLKWLIDTVKIDRRLIVLEINQNYSNNRRGRPDILVKNRRDKPCMVIELKKPGTGLSYDIFLQAKRYANKSGASEIWLSNGTDNIFYRKTGSKWEMQERSLILNRRVQILEKPFSPHSEKGVRKLLRHMSKLNGSTLIPDKSLFPLVSAIRKIITFDDLNKHLPFSHDGFHLIEDRGFSKISVTTPGGTWLGEYRLFLGATEGRVETIGIGQQIWKKKAIILCVIIINEKRKHHALQIRLPYYSKSNDKGWMIVHDGRMGGRSINHDQVLDSVSEAGLNLMIKKNEKRLINLGLLPKYVNLSWNSSKIFLCNLFHYALIRSNLRDTNPYSRK